jgi:ParB-like chromosome segregation protein Spo0J
LINATGEIIAGHARVEAAKAIGLNQIPCIRVEHLSEAQERAYRLADNRLAELATWDSELLARELEDLTEIDLDFSIDATGFDTAEIETIIENGKGQWPDPADGEPPPAVDRPAVARAGDVWKLGPHRLLCGDAREARSFERLIDSEKAQVGFTDVDAVIRRWQDFTGKAAIHAATEMTFAEVERLLAPVRNHPSSENDEEADHV